MDSRENIITTMGIIADKVYNLVPGKDFFSDTPDLVQANGHTYKVIDATPDSNPLGDGFNAFLLKEVEE